MSSPRSAGSGHDVVVLGSGAAGLTAALAAAAGGADVGLYEKADVLGGTTAISGGIVWVPGNHLMDPAVRDDDPAEALRYLRALAGDALDVAVAEAFVSAGPEMLRLVEGASPCRFRLLAGYPDYHPDVPGAAATLGPLDEPPFYAVAIRIGALGTSGGPRTDRWGRVLNRSGEAIPGLWAAGNVMAASTATVYGGAGGTLGPAMTFGYLAGRDAARTDS